MHAFSRLKFWYAFVVLLIAAVSSVQAQADVQHPLPYNPDSDASGTILTPDLMQLLTVFGEEFEPVGCQEPVALEVRVEQLEAQLAEQNAFIEQIIAHLGRMQPTGPFAFDETRGVWVTAAPIEVYNALSSESLKTGRIEAGGAHFGGNVVVGD